MPKSNFKEALKKQNIDLNEETIKKFDEYYTLLVNENEKYNLTAITNEDDVFDKHFYDSLSMLFYYDLKDKKLLDVGAGAGFPSLPLKIVEDSIDLYVLDSTQKRMMFIEMLKEKLSLNKVTTLVARAEEYKEQQFDIVTARGVAKLNVLLEICCDLVKENGLVIFLKGSNYLNEINEAKQAMKTLGYTLIETKEYQMFDDTIHYLVTLQKSKKHSNKYPRSYAKIKKQPL